jgi:hypothetical protein
MDRRLRRVFVVVLTLVGFAFVILAAAPPIIEDTGTNSVPQPVVKLDGSAIKALDSLEVKGRASKAGYERSQFGNGWATVNGCDTRNIILYRDLKEVTLGDECTVMSGTLVDPYTATTITFIKGSSDIQIDHVVALSDAWQTGAQALTKALRVQLANDPLELLAVQGEANQQKGDANAASWLPSHKAFRCQYVARQIAVKQKYTLWVIPAEKQAMATVLSACPDEPLPVK